MTVIPVDVAGPDYYCPDCKRWLVRVREDGSVDLARKASFVASVEVEPGAGHADAFGVEATCLLRRCRLRRWLKGTR